MRLRITSLVGCLVIIAAALTVPVIAADRPPATKPHIILITIDTLRTDAVSCMGCPRQTTPFLDSLAARGTLFSNAYSSSSWTVPGVASMLTSLYPSAHGVTHGEIVPGTPGTPAVHQQPMLSASLLTLAEMLRAAGYRTIGVVSNRHLQGGTGFEQGFDYYYDEAAFCHAAKLNDTVRELMTKAAGKRWKRAWKRRPTFLWVHYFDPHHPYTPYEPWIQEYAPDFRESPEKFPSTMKADTLNAGFKPTDTEMIRRVTALYHSEVRYTDEQVRRLLEELDPDDDTLIIFTSDHGEELGERTQFGHRRTLFDEVTKVPLFIVRPSSLPKGKRIDTLVSILDILPTIAEVAGCVVPEGSQGHNLLPLLSGEQTATNAPMLLELHPPNNGGMRSLVRDHWKLVRSFDGTGRPSLYDLSADPRELVNVAGRNRDTVRSLNRQLDSVLKGLPEPPEVQIFTRDDEEEIDQLRALGYVD